MKLYKIFLPSYNKHSRLEIYVIGTRGFPGIQGGVEEHCENLYTQIASDEFLITVFRRIPYIKDSNIRFNNIRFIDLPSTKAFGFEAFYHSLICTIITLLKRPDIVHIHNIGPGIFIPLLKAFRLKVIMTYHSPNYEHKKWSKLARYFLKLAEYLSLKFSYKVIFVSKYQKEKLGNKANFIHINNGVKSSSLTENVDYINHLGLQSHKYVLSVGRFVEEKNFDLLIDSFSKIQQNGIKLVIAGDGDHETSYLKKIRALAKTNAVVLTGFIRGEKLLQLYCHARLFVLPSLNEGLAISLLEAMSYHIPVLASDIPANKQIDLTKNRFFKSGDEESLIRRLEENLYSDHELINYDMTPYDWDQIATLTKSVYKQVLKLNQR